jgi:hypothetical protein
MAARLRKAGAVSAAQQWIVEPMWYRVTKWSKAASRLVDGVELGLLPHYSRQSVGSDQVMAPGETLLMLTPDERGVWAVVHNMEPMSTAKQWRCTIYRNEGGQRSSALATALTLDYWPRKYGWPDVPLRTEVDPSKTRHKRDPGRCFRKAGWEPWGWTEHGLLVLLAPGERARVGLQGPVMKRARRKP